jgi:hypothetical protein
VSKDSIRHLVPCESSDTFSGSPTPEGTAKDSVSIGFGISAVQASFEPAPESLSDR